MLLPYWIRKQKVVSSDAATLLLFKTDRQIFGAVDYLIELLYH